MTTLSTFYTYVKDEARRGSAFDSVIPRKVRQAVQQFERTWTFKHMDRFIDLAIPMAPVSGVPNQVTIPLGFKKMQLWRLRRYENIYGQLDCSSSSGSGSSGHFIYSRITQVDITDQSKLNYSHPKGYWEDGYGNFWLDCLPNRDYNSEMFFVGYTQLPSDGDSSTDIPLLTNYEDVLIYASMVLLAPTMRSDDAATMYKALRDECMKTAIDSDVENRQAGRSESMQYGWEYKEDININRGDRYWWLE